MDIGIFLVLGSLILLVANGIAGHRLGEAGRKFLLLLSALPPLMLMAETGWVFARALMDIEEANRRFQNGDLTYFGADMAFGMSLLVGLPWVALAYWGYRVGQPK